MSLILRVKDWLAVAGLLICFPAAALAQSDFASQGAEYAVAGKLPGDQTKPQLALSKTGGILVWQDNATDGAGLGISAQRLNNSLSAELGVFRVNSVGAGDQENPQVALLKNGQTAFVWQGGAQGFQNVYARFMGPSGTFLTSDILVNSYTNNQQVNPVIAPLSDGNAAVVWASSGQDGSMQGVFGQRLSLLGQKIGSEFQVNYITQYNQRSPAMAALAGGSFVVVWVSEQQRFENSVDVYGRVFKANGEPAGNEFRINDGDNVCANPAVAATSNGGFTVVWGQVVGRSTAVYSESGQTPVPGQYYGKIVVQTQDATNGWDIISRPFDSNGAALSAANRINSFNHGDQFAPRIAARANDLLAVWTSLGQDGSWEGVYGRFMNSLGEVTGNEFRVNATTASSQFQPAVASDTDTRFLVVWSSFVGGSTSFDIFGQRYAGSQAAEPLPKPAPPYVVALSPSRLSVTWPELAGFQVDRYELFIDDKTTPVAVADNYFVATQFAPGSSHAFKLRYKLADGRQSPLSDPASGTTWNEDLNGDGLPDDWQALYWGPKSDNWPGSKADSDGDGATNFQEFLAGTNPTDPNSVLRTTLISTSQGWRLGWNTQPGFIYQVQESINFNDWANLGKPRFAAADSDSIAVSGARSTAYYRVIRIR